MSLGHAAFFGLGGYAPLFAKHVMPDPLVGLAVGIGAAVVLGAVASLPSCAALRASWSRSGVGLRCWSWPAKLDWLTGGADGLQGRDDGPVKPVRI